MKHENADGFTAIIVGKDRFKRTAHAGVQARVALGGRRRDQPRHARRRCVDGVDRQQPMGARLLCVMVALSLSAAVNLPTELRRPRILPMPWVVGTREAATAAFFLPARTATKPWPVSQNARCDRQPQVGRRQKNHARRYSRSQHAPAMGLFDLDWDLRWEQKKPLPPAREFELWLDGTLNQMPASTPCAQPHVSARFVGDSNPPCLQCGPRRFGRSLTARPRLRALPRRPLSLGRAELRAWTAGHLLPRAKPQERAGGTLEKMVAGTAEGRKGRRWPWQCWRACTRA